MQILIMNVNTQRYAGKNNMHKVQLDVHYLLAAVFFVYCVIVFTAVIFAKLDSPTCSCNDTVVNWFIKERFCNLHVWFMCIRAINPL
jgi:hypothetical protein